VLLSATANEKKFKLNFLDTVFVSKTCGVNGERVLTDDVMLLNQGARAEQFDGQELLANAPTQECERVEGQILKSDIKKLSHRQLSMRG
jgi:hypothetical protein